jgi:hypothetical protein
MRTTVDLDEDTLRRAKQVTLRHSREGWWTREQ